MRPYPTLSRVVLVSSRTNQGSALFLGDSLIFIFILLGIRGFKRPRGLHAPRAVSKVRGVFLFRFGGPKSPPIFFHPPLVKKNRQTLGTAIRPEKLCRMAAAFFGPATRAPLFAGSRMRGAQWLPGA